MFKTALRLVVLKALLLMTSLLLLGACQEPAQKQPPTIRVGHAPHDHHSPLYIAAMNPDYFREHGGLYLKEVKFREEYQLIDDEELIARVVISSSTGGATIVRRLAENQLDMTYGGVPAILASIDQHHPIRMVAPVMAEGAGLVVTDSMPANNWEEFIAHIRASDRTIRIGHKGSGSVQGLIFERALEASNIRHNHDMADSAAQVHVLNMSGPQNLLPSMENGIIDGYVVMQPYLAIAEAKGSGKTISHLREMPPTGKWHKHPCCALAANDTFIRTHQDESRKLLTLLERARRFLREQPELGAQQVAKWLGTDVEVERRSLPTIDFEVAIDQSWHEGVAFWIEEMMADGKISNMVRDAHRSGRVSEILYDHDTYQAISRKGE